MQTPVLFLVFNRPKLTSLVFDAIRQVRPAQLFIAADGPRNGQGDERARCNEVREIVSRVDWDCSVKTLFRDTHLGCGSAISSALNWFFGEVTEGIILEDDCLPDSSFFRYTEAMLERFRDDPSILSIGGNNLGYQNPTNRASWGYSRFMNMWGWATWSDRAVKINYSMAGWEKPGASRHLWTCLLQSRPRFLAVEHAWKEFWKEIFDKVHHGIIDTWDYQWIYHGVTHRMYSIFPTVNLVHNLGYGADATHTRGPNHPIARLPRQSMRFPLVPPGKKSIDPAYEIDCVRHRWCGLYDSRRRDIWAALNELLPPSRHSFPND